MSRSTIERKIAEQTDITRLQSLRDYLPNFLNMPTMELTQQDIDELIIIIDDKITELNA